MQIIFSASDLQTALGKVSYLFPRNTLRKNAFLAVCYCIDKDVNLWDINDMAEFGGLIGPGNSILDKYFKHFKIFRLHAIFHDAFGFMKSNFDLGPGYVYALSHKPILTNNMLLGHFTGLAYWLHMKIYRTREYEKFLL